MTDSLAEFWDAVDRTFALAADGKNDAARAQVSLSLQARQAALGTAVARLLIENNEAEEQAAERVQRIYDQVQRQVYLFFTATLVAIAATGLYLIRANRRLFAELAVALGRPARAGAAAHRNARDDAAGSSRVNCTTRLVRYLTAIGSMLGRAEKQTPPSRRFAPTYARFARWPRARSTACAACRRRLHP